MVGRGFENQFRRIGHEGDPQHPGPEQARKPSLEHDPEMPRKWAIGRLVGRADRSCLHHRSAKGLTHFPFAYWNSVYHILLTFAIGDVNLLQELEKGSALTMP